MKIFLAVFSVILLFACGTNLHSDYEQLKQNRENSALWDYNMFQNDSSFAVFQNDSGFLYHTPKYDLIRPFCGVGSFALSGGDSNEINLDDHRIVFNSFYVKSCKGENPEVFFKIAILMDSIDTLNYAHFQSEIISRNHPDILGKGVFRIFNRMIHYKAMHFDHGKDVALINDRIFHLELGNFILIRVTKSGMIFTRQVNTIENHLVNMLTEVREIIRKNKTFFLDEKDIK